MYNFISSTITFDFAKNDAAQQPKLIYINEFKFTYR